MLSRHKYRFALTDISRTLYRLGIIDDLRYFGESPGNVNRYLDKCIEESR